MKSITRFLRNNLVGMKGICITLSALLLAITVYCLNLESEKEQITKMAKSNKSILLSIVSDSYDFREFKHWRLSADGISYIISENKDELQPDFPSEVVRKYDAIFAQYPFDKVDIFYDDAYNLKIDFSQEVKETDSKIIYHLIYMSPQYNLLLVPGSIDMLFQFDLSDNIVFDNWYCVSQRINDAD